MADVARARHGSGASRRRHTKAPLIPRMLLFLPAVLLYYELVFKLFGGTEWSFRSAFVTVFFTLSAGALLYLLCSVFSRKVNRRIVLGVLSVLPVVYLIEFFLRRAFGFYYSISDILSQGDQVAGSYSGSIITIVASGWYVVVLFFVPLAVFAMVGRYFVPAEKALKGHRILSAAAFVLTYLIAMLTTVTATSATLGEITLKGAYHSHFSADTAMPRFGLLTTLRLDIKYMIFDIPAEEAGDVGTDEDFEIGGETSSSKPIFSVDPGDFSNPSSGGEYIPQGDNVLDINFSALLAGESDATVKKMHEYFANQTPTEKNRYTGMFEGKNLIFVVAEALSPYAIDPERTPTLYRLATSGVVTTNYYQPCWGQSTSGGEYSALLGQIPTRKNEKEKGLSMYLGRNNNWYYSMGNVLSRAGYLSLAFHNNTYDYYDRDETHDNLGYQYYGKLGGLMGRTFTGNYQNRFESIVERIEGKKAYLDGTVSNGIDVDMIDTTLPLYIDKEPFNIYYLTMSGHNPYTMGNKKTQKYLSYVQNLPYSDIVKAYLAYQMELETAMASLVQQLEAAGKAENTVICLTADHYPYALDNNAFGNTQDYTGELMGKSSYTIAERDQSVLILWNKGMQPVLVEKACSSIDVLPTLLNLFGVEYDSRLLPGKDILSAAEGAVVFVDYSWVTDKGHYVKGKFYPAEGAGFANQDEIKQYVKETDAALKKQVEYSRYIRQKDYYDIIFG